MNIEPRYNPMYRIPALSVAILLTSALLFVGCDSGGINSGSATGSNGDGSGSDESSGGGSPTVKTVTDLPADPPQNTSGGGRPQGTGRYTFFSLEDDTIVLSYSNTNRADSNSTKWDLGFQSTNVLVNGGTSGPGDGAAYVAKQPFGDVTTVKTDAFETDDADAGTFAIPQGSGNGWYNYNRNTNVVSPLPGRTIVVRTADGNQYAKIDIQSYYKGAPDKPSRSDPSRYYTFKYVVSDDPSFE